MLAGILALGGAALVATLTSASEVQVPSRDVHLGDVSKITGTNAESTTSWTIARLPRAGAAVTLSRSQLADLVRRLVPGAMIAGCAGKPVTIRSAAMAAPARPKPYVPETPTVERGQKLTLRSAAGPVVIERPVIALQSASQSDKRLFVRTADGDVISAPLAWVAQ